LETTFGSVLECLPSLRLGIDIGFTVACPEPEARRRIASYLGDPSSALDGHRNGATLRPGRRLSLFP